MIKVERPGSVDDSRQIDARNDGYPSHSACLASFDCGQTLDLLLEVRLADVTTAHWLARLKAAGIACGTLYDSARALKHPQSHARKMATTNAFPDGSSLLAAGNPIKRRCVADTTKRSKAPTRDEHREIVLADLGL